MPVGRSQRCDVTDKLHSLSTMILFKTLAVLYSLNSLYTVAAVTVYGQVPLGHQTQSAALAAGTVKPLPAYDETVLVPPALPSPAPSNQWTLELQNTGANVPNLSIRMPGSFYGFSIEMSVITQVGEHLSFDRSSNLLITPGKVGRNSSDHLLHSSSLVSNPLLGL